MWYNYKKEVIVMYHFTPPNKYKRIYIFANIVIILSIISIAVFFYGQIEILGIPIALWCLFNGLWSVNANWYSWFHRNDKSSFSHGFWLISLITGFVMTVLLVAIHLLMWLSTPFRCSYLHLRTFWSLFRIKRLRIGYNPESFSVKSTFGGWNRYAVKSFFARLIHKTRMIYALNAWKLLNFK